MGSVGGALEDGAGGSGGVEAAGHEDRVVTVGVLHGAPARGFDGVEDVYVVATETTGSVGDNGSGHAAW